MVTRIHGSRSALACIPSSSSIRSRLATVQEEVHKLSILLRTAEDLERVQSHDNEAQTARPDQQPYPIDEQQRGIDDRKKGGSR